MYVCASIYISGMVQGVGYRYFAYHRAAELGLNGYVCNKDDGLVYMEVEGQRSAIESFIDFLKQGPRLAHVADIKLEWKKHTGKYNGFSIRD
jgi:acylphosphatase